MDTTCKHFETVGEYVDVYNDWTGETNSEWSTREVHWTEDIDVG